MINKTVLFVFTVFLFFESIAQQIPLDKLDRYIDSIETNQLDIGSISVFHEGKEIYNRNFGQQYLPYKKFNKKTGYQIGSISKLITAVLICKVIEDQKLSFDTKLSEFFPDIPNASAITIENLLEHTSGLGDYVEKKENEEWLKQAVTEKEILDEIIRQGVNFQPDEKFEYSNSGYYLLAKIVEKKYNKPYHQVVKEHIAKPYRLKYFTSVHSGNKNIFRSYKWKDSTWNFVQDFDFTNAVGVGDIIAIPSEMNTFINHLFSYKILGKEIIDFMKPNSEEFFGRGIMVIPYYEILSYGHGGDTYGTHSLLAYNEAENLSVAYAINGENYSAKKFATDVFTILFEGKRTAASNAIQVDTAVLDQYTGTYASDKLPIKLYITRKGNELIAQGEGQSAISLTAIEKNIFTVDKIMLKLTFFPDKNMMILEQNGAKFEMIRNK